VGEVLPVKGQEIRAYLNRQCLRLVNRIMAGSSLVRCVYCVKQAPVASHKSFVDMPSAGQQEMINAGPASLMMASNL